MILLGIKHDAHIAKSLIKQGFDKVQIIYREEITR